MTNNDLEKQIFNAVQKIQSSPQSNEEMGGFEGLLILILAIWIAYCYFF